MLTKQERRISLSIFASCVQVLFTVDNSHLFATVNREKMISRAITGKPQKVSNGFQVCVPQGKSSILRLLLFLSAV